MWSKEAEAQREEFRGKIKGKLDLVSAFIG
jgi:hypothetical protein